MSRVRDPLLQLVPISDLRPTQITVGMREVEEKRKRWKEQHPKKRQDFLARHLVPVILGPSERPYVIDHHHLALALHEEGVKEVRITVVADLSKLDREMFWFMLDCRDWMHPFDDHGRRRDYTDIPKSVDKLIDDPYRSLAGGLRRVGGFSKDTTPFSEFLWAQFLRGHIKRRDIERDFTHAMDAALEVAKSQHAEFLPGWCGPSEE